MTASSLLVRRVLYDPEKLGVSGFAEPNELSCLVSLCGLLNTAEAFDWLADAPLDEETIGRLGTAIAAVAAAEVDFLRLSSWPQAAAALPKTQAMLPAVNALAEALRRLAQLGAIAAIQAQRRDRAAELVRLRQATIDQTGTIIAATRDAA